MRLHVDSHDGHRIRLRFPTRLLLNRATTGIIMKHLPDEVEQGINSLSREQLHELIKCVMKAKHILGSEDLINVVSADGDRVRISL